MNNIFDNMVFFLIKTVYSNYKRNKFKFYWQKIIGEICILLTKNIFINTN